MADFPGARPTIRARLKGRYPAGYIGDAGLSLVVQNGVVRGALDYASLVEDVGANAGDYIVAARHRITGETRAVGLDQVDLGPISIADVTDATPTGQSVVTSASASAARSAIGAASTAVATTSNPGLQSALDKTKLDSLPDGVATSPEAIAAALNDRAMSPIRTADQTDARLFAAPRATTAAGLTAALAVNKAIHFPPDLVVSLADDYTIQPGTRISFAPGARIDIASGKTLSIFGLVEAGAHWIFGGAGKVVGLRAPKSAWFNVKADCDGVSTGTDDTAALNRWLECIGDSFAGDGCGQEAIAPRGRCLISGTVTMTVSSLRNLRLLGGGANGVRGFALFTSAGFPAATPALWVRPPAGDDPNVPDYRLDGVSINKMPGSTATIGLRIGDVSRAGMNPFSPAHVSGINVFDFQTTLELVNTRHIVFDRCGFWNKNTASSTCVKLYSSSDALFVGDLTFNDCTFVVNGDATSSHFYAHADGGLWAGVRLNKCIFYDGGKLNLGAPGCIRLRAEKNGAFGDFWCTSGQFDNCSMPWKIEVAAPSPVLPEYAQPTGESYRFVADFHFEHNYQTSSNTGVLDVDADPGYVQGLFLENNWFRGASGDSSVRLRGVKSATIGGNQFFGTSGGGTCIFDLIDCYSVKINDNPALTTPADASRLTYYAKVSGSSTYDVRIGVNPYLGRCTNYVSKGSLTPVQVSVSRFLVSDTGNSAYRTLRYSDGWVVQKGRGALAAGKFNATYAVPYSDLPDLDARVISGDQPADAVVSDWTGAESATAFEVRAAYRSHSGGGGPSTASVFWKAEGYAA